MAEQSTKYRYTGPLSGVTLREKGEDGAVTERQVPLSPGAELDLPAGHPWVRKAYLKGLLQPIDPSDPAGAKPPRAKRAAESPADPKEATDAR